MAFESKDAHKMGFKANIVKDATGDSDSNYFSMQYHSAVDEEIYGMGL